MGDRRVADLIALEQLSIEYWDCVDVENGQGIGQLWTEEAVLNLADKELVGRDAVVGFYEWRRNRGPRVSLHAVVNFRCEFEADDIAKVSTGILLFGADGVAPVKGTMPLAILRSRDVCKRGDDGRWRYQSRSLIGLFEGAGSSLPFNEILPSKNAAPR